MATYAAEKRGVLKKLFEGSCGDQSADGSIPVFISRRETGKTVLSGTERADGPVLSFGYRLADASLTDADVPRLFHIAYLDVFTGHAWRERVRGKHSQLTLELTNLDTNHRVSLPYPDPE